MDTKIFETEIGIPIADVSKDASSKVFCSIKSASLFMQIALWAPVNLLHEPFLKAYRAAATASSMSSPSATWMSEDTTESLAGLWTVNRFTDFELTYYRLDDGQSSTPIQEKYRMPDFIVNEELRLHFDLVAEDLLRTIITIVRSLKEIWDCLGNARLD